ncbi:hypothetical protein [Sphingobium yanoikuyae]|uniref:hypothetical protein n=1 Tax=Sphingobium yanoikuyae TaxID=13690 RepID=UPI0035C76B17
MKPVSPAVEPGRTGKSQKLVLVQPETVARMRLYLDGRTDEKLNARFGISYNSWRKIAAGQAVRASLANRLMARLSCLDAHIERADHG